MKFLLLLLGCVVDVPLIGLSPTVHETETPVYYNFNPVHQTTNSPIEPVTEDTIEPDIDPEPVDTVSEPIENIDTVYDETTHPTMDSDGAPLYPTIPLDFQDTGIAPVTTTGTLEDCNIPDDFMLVTYEDLDQDGFGSLPYRNWPDVPCSANFQITGNRGIDIIDYQHPTSYNWFSWYYSHGLNEHNITEAMSGPLGSQVNHIFQPYPIPQLAKDLYPEIYSLQSGTERFYAALEIINNEGMIWPLLSAQEALTIRRKDFRDQLVYISEQRCLRNQQCNGIRFNYLPYYFYETYLTYEAHGYHGEPGYSEIKIGSPMSATFWLGDNGWETRYDNCPSSYLARLDVVSEHNEGFFTCSWFADDADGDGFSLEDGDCNDGAAWISPNAREIPNNGVDNDCDGTELCFTDSDNDGYRGVTETTTIIGTACPSILPLQDCDDNDSSKNPERTEIACNYIDENCDGRDM
jgi:hypothetical protein